MAINYYFFNAVESGGVYDRVYDADDFSNYLSEVVGNGVFADPSSSLQVVSDSGMNILVHSGAGWINGHKIVNTNDYSLTVDAADVVNPRIDRVIMYLDNSARTMGISILKGTPAASPVAPALTRTNTRYEMSLATIRVGKQVTSLDDTVITDTRANSTVCGWVAGLIDQIDTTELFNQFSAAFNAWFTDVQEAYTSKILTADTYQHITTAFVYGATVDNWFSDWNYSTDILEVYLNGLRLAEDVDYTLGLMSSNETRITFTNAIPAGNEIIGIRLQNAIS